MESRKPEEARTVDLEERGERARESERERESASPFSSARRKRGGCLLRLKAPGDWGGGDPVCRRSKETASTKETPSSTRATRVCMPLGRSLVNPLDSVTIA